MAEIDLEISDKRSHSKPTKRNDNNNINNNDNDSKPSIPRALSQMSQTHCRQKSSSYNVARFIIARKKTKSRRGPSIVGVSNEASEPLVSNNENQKMPLCDFKKDFINIKRMILGNWVNLLLIFVPFGFISSLSHWNQTVVFFINFLGMIPLASILGDATETLAEHLGETVGGLLNATFGNAVEIVVMILALIKAKSYDNPDDQENKENLLIVVQTSLIGSIFSNALLVLGCAFFANGIYYKESSFNVTATTANTSLLMISAFVMLLPGPYALANSTHDVLSISRAAALILMLMYIALLIFVLKTHKDIMSPEESVIEIETDKLDLLPIGNINNSDPANLDSNNNNNIDNYSDESDDDEPELTLFGSLSLLFVSTILVAVLSEFLVGSIEPMADNLGMKPCFVGIILLPIVGNAVEHITAIRMALKNKMDIALSIAIGSATQVAMFVVSLAVLIGWCMDLELSLCFDPFETNLFIYSSIIIFAIIADGSSNWLEGVMLLALYLLVAVAVWDQTYTYTPSLTE